MRVGAGVLFTLAVLAGPVAAGELLLANGSRLQADLANEVLLVSTGSGLVELNPEGIAGMTPAEIRLKDGRVLQGTLVGGRIRTRTALGELAIQVDELHSFRAESEPAAPAAPAVVTPAPPPAPGALTSTDGLPSVSLYQPEAKTPATTASVTRTAPAPAPATPGVAPAGAGPGKPLQVVSEQSALYRDALSAATAVGRVVRGETVTYLDS
ncbi:MAG TPA: hypothetical protein VLF95_06840, partial [Vicinamibacteria bacterium]|nr:hypothetical protein [Vicinamibacteria bacterium]